MKNLNNAHVLKKCIFLYTLFLLEFQAYSHNSNFYKTDFDSIHSKYIQTPELSITPSRGVVLFSFTSEEIEPVSLTILSIHGTVVYTIHNPYYLNSMNTIEWTGVDINGNKVPTGTYICILHIGKSVYSQKFFYSKL